MNRELRRYAAPFVIAVAALFLAACGSNAPAPVFTWSPSPEPSPSLVPSLPYATTRPSRPVLRVTTMPPVRVATPGGFLCRDGSISHAKHRQGACSHHGGIA